MSSDARRGMLLNVACMLTLGQAGLPASPVFDDTPPTIPTAGELMIAVRNDLATMPEDVRLETRYLRQPADMDLKQWGKLCAVLSGHVNGMSSRGDIYKPRRVGKHLLRIQFSFYGWQAE